MSFWHELLAANFRLTSQITNRRNDCAGFWRRKKPQTLADFAGEKPQGRGNARKAEGMARIESLPLISSGTLLPGVPLFYFELLRHGCRGHRFRAFSRIAQHSSGFLSGAQGSIFAIFANEARMGGKVAGPDIRGNFLNGAAHLFQLLLFA